MCMTKQMVSGITIKLPITLVSLQVQELKCMYVTYVMHYIFTLSETTPTEYTLSCVKLDCDYVSLVTIRVMVTECSQLH